MLIIFTVLQEIVEIDLHSHVPTATKYRRYEISVTNLLEVSSRSILEPV